MDEPLGRLSILIRRARRLSFREVLDLGPALWRLLIIRFSLLGSIAATRDRFGGPAESPENPLLGNSKSADQSQIALWQRRARALRRASRMVPGAHCLARALALRWWMRGLGQNAVVVIGVRRAARGIASHAWVEYHGLPIDESMEIVQKFQVISQDNLPSTGWSR